jgi:hypothetical protein
MAKKAPRNPTVERAVRKALERVDQFITGTTLNLPEREYRNACDALFFGTGRKRGKSASVKTALLFLMFYWLEDPSWDVDTPPVAWRGPQGDKLLCTGLSERQITMHNAIKAFGENLGTKGDVGTKHLATDTRFRDFLSAVQPAPPEQRRLIADYFAQKFAESKQVVSPLPPVGAHVLTYARAKVLFHQLVASPSEGHIQQFLIAALLYEYRRREAIIVVTHHPHAADKFSKFAGDIEESKEGERQRAYEVTVRPDWKTNVLKYRDKMDEFRLKKYVIIASNINTDEEWKVPAVMLEKLDKVGRDIAVVDIIDVVHFLAAELTAEELRAAVNKAYSFLTDLQLCGRADFIEMYRGIVQHWLDTATS